MATFALPDPLDVNVLLDEYEPSYDWLIPQVLERGDRVIFTGNEGKGKALACDTLVPTVDGWKTMGMLRAGDRVFSPAGAPVRVKAVTSSFIGDCYRVVFSDGASVVADIEHQWVTESYAARQPTFAEHGAKIHTTREIMGSLRVRNVANHAVEVAQPLRWEARELPISPYTLGAWLGDGHSKQAVITCVDEGVLDEIRAEGWDVQTKAGTKYGHTISNHRMRDGFEARARKLGVWGNKHIPREYLTASVEQRMALLQGLMDTDGTAHTADGATRYELSLCNERLAQDAHELLLGLGVKTRLLSNKAKLYGKETGTRWRLAFGTDLPVFRLRRKAERCIPLRTQRARYRYITGVEKTVDVPVRCIEVEGGSYVVGKECITTHNSTLLRQIAVQTAMGIHPFTLEDMEPRRVLLIDLENPARQVRRKLMEVVRERPIRDGMLYVARWPAGIDLTHPAEVEAMGAVLSATQPELLVIGPMYKLAQHLDKEDASAQLASILDQWRTIFNMALIMESHQPQQVVADGMRYRPERPFGSSLWLRWPEFGICLEDRGTLRHWRGPREERAWPDKLYRGDEWPWMVEALGCVWCGTPLKDTQEKYCSERCGNAARVSKHRARERGG